MNILPLSSASKSELRKKPAMSRWLKMEPILFPETSVGFYQITWRYIQEDSALVIAGRTSSLTDMSNPKTYTQLSTRFL
jgi:hypothetical protein